MRSCTAGSLKQDQHLLQPPIRGAAHAHIKVLVAVKVVLMPCCALLFYYLLQWLDECLQHHQTMQQQLQQQEQQLQQADAAAAATALPDPQLFAAVVGAASEQERVRSAKAAGERDVAGGFSCLGNDHV
jgi:hypothetical protein